MSKKIIIENVHPTKSWITILDSTTNVFIQGKFEQDEIHIMFQDPSNKEPITKENCKLFLPFNLRDENGKGFTDITASSIPLDHVRDLMYEIIKKITEDMTSALCEAINSPEECYKIEMQQLEWSWFVYYIKMIKKNIPSVSEEVPSEE